MTEVRKVVPQTAFANNRVAAHSVGQHISPHRFSVKPYNRFVPESSEWWFFVPRGPEPWPAFRFSKLFIQTFRLSSEESRLMCAGFYVEKGFDPVLSGWAGIKPTNIMQSDWYWHTFLDLASRAQYNESISEVRNRSGCPVWISVDTQEFNKPPELDAERPPFYDIVQFTVQTDDLKLHLERPGKKTLSQLNDCQTIENLAERLRGMEDLQFFWVNTLIGVVLAYGEDRPGTWGAAELWHNALEPWDDWV